jgi:hypothetical protein
VLFRYVAQVDYELGSKKTVATVGLSYPLNDGAVLKAKLNSGKLVSCCLLLFVVCCCLLFVVCFC